MFFGKPVISSDKTSLKEIGAGHTFFWENFEPQHMADKIREAIQTYQADPSMSISNKEYAKSFSYDKHLKRYNEIFREMMKESVQKSR